MKSWNLLWLNIIKNINVIILLQDDDDTKKDFDLIP